MAGVTGAQHSQERRLWKPLSLTRFVSGW